MKTSSSRRRFLSAAAGGSGLLTLRHSGSVWGYQANEKLNIALIGLGARGGSAHVKSFPRIGENLVALCDVNQEKLDLQLSRTSTMPVPSWNCSTWATSHPPSTARWSTAPRP